MSLIYVNCQHCTGRLSHGCLFFFFPVYLWILIAAVDVELQMSPHCTVQGFYYRKRCPRDTGATVQHRVRLFDSIHWQTTCNQSRFHLAADFFYFLHPAAPLNHRLSQALWGRTALGAVNWWIPVRFTCFQKDIFLRAAFHPGASCWLDGGYT